MAKEQTVLVSRGDELTMVADGFVTSGTYVRLGNPGGTVYTPVAVSAGATVAIGPFNEDRYYKLSYDNGSISYSFAYEGVFDPDDLTTANEAICDAVGGMVTGNTETGITVTYEDSDNTLDFVVSDEFICDTVGAMVTGNTETGIAVTYEDLDNTLDFAVDGWVSATTFTPVLEGMTSAGAGTYTTQVGHYQKVGKVVTGVINLVWSAHTGTGNLKITGLPVASRAGLTQKIPGLPNGISTATDHIYMKISSGATEGSLHYINAAAETAVAMDTAGELHFNFSYMTD